MNSGIKPNLMRSTGWICSSRFESRRAPRAVLGGLIVGMHEAHGLGAHPARDDLFEADERAAADEKDVRRVDRGEFLMRVLASALRRDVGDGPFQDLQKRLLDALARDIAGDGGIFVLPPDLVDLVDIDDALLAALDIPVGVLEQPEDDVLDIFADVAGLGEGGGIDDGERHIEDARKRLSQKGFARARGSDEQDVRFGQLDFGAALLVHLDALVVVVNRHRELLLGAFLPDNVLIQILFQLQRLGEFMWTAVRLLMPVVLQNGVANGNALVADVRTRIVAGGRDQLPNNILAFVAERTAEGIVGTGTFQAVSLRAGSQVRSISTEIPL